MRSWAYACSYVSNSLPFPTQGDLPDPGMEPMSLTSPALAGRFFTIRATWEVPCMCILCFYNHVHPSFSTSIIILHTLLYIAFFLLVLILRD